MATQNNHNNTPDSWDQQDAGDINEASQLNEPMSNLALNVDAAVFVPGQNVHAREFVMPCFTTNVESKFPYRH